jgi:hypothetical protein
MHPKDDELIIGSEKSPRSIRRLQSFFKDMKRFKLFNATLESLPKELHFHRAMSQYLNFSLYTI